MHELLFSNQQALGQGDLVRYALSAGVSESPFRKCLAGDSVNLVRKDRAEGASLGVQGTPRFFVGTVGADGKMRVIRELTGAQPFAVFKEILDSALVELSRSAN